MIVVRVYREEGALNGGRSLVPVYLVGHDIVEVVSSHETVVVEVSLAENVG